MGGREEEAAALDRLRFAQLDHRLAREGRHGGGNDGGIYSETHDDEGSNVSCEDTAESQTPGGLGLFFQHLLLDFQFHCFDFFAPA